jgi:D-alanyl-D-alanine carboxypeptidase (penicillin-binding protein 5/6)
MTALLIVEAVDRGELSLNDVVTIGLDPILAGGSGMQLSLGDRVNIRDLLYGTMLPSGNDAATALAIALDGNLAAFVDRMNDRAAALGLDDLSFTNPHGRDPEDVTPLLCDGNAFDLSECAHFASARDLAALARFAMTRPLFATIVGTPGRFTTSWRNAGGVDIDRRLCNSNRLIRDGSGGCSSSSSRYAGAYGVKTGTTDLAGQCLVSGADDGMDDVMAVILGSTDRYDDSELLLDWGFSSL